MILELDQIHLPLAGFALNLSARMEHGITGLSGPSGSGKTSLLEVIAGLRPAAAGRVMLQGVALQDSARGLFCPPWKRKIGYVPQDQALFPHWSVQENLASSARFAGRIPDAAMQSRVADLLELTPLLARRTGALSGGEKARVALGRALMSRPALLLLDEPMAHLDDRLRDIALDYLKTAAAEFQLPILIVSHSGRELAAVCSSILRMERGMLLEE